jgi:hypothetical protein
MSQESSPLSQETCIESFEELQNFVGNLPKAKTDVGEMVGGIRSYFEALSEQGVADLQSSVFWLRIWSGALNWGGGGYVGLGYPSGDFMVRPYWLLGKNHFDSKNQQFLVAPASFPVHRGDIDTGNYVNYDTWSPVHRFLNSNYSGIYLYNPGISKQESLATLSTKRLNVGTSNTEQLPIRVDHKDKRATVITAYARLAMRHFSKVEHMSDEQLASFQPADYAGKLARLTDLI